MGFENPSFRNEGQCDREVFIVVMEGVSCDAYYCTGGTVDAVDERTTGQDTASKETRDGRGEAKRFVDDGAEVG